MQERIGAGARAVLHPRDARHELRAAEAQRHAEDSAQYAHHDALDQELREHVGATRADGYEVVDMDDSRVDKVLVDAAAGRTPLP